MDSKAWIGVLTLLIAVASYSLYFKDIFAGKTKPHAVSWLVWAVLNSVTFATQASNGAGAGGWITGFAGLISALIFITALWRGEKNITRLDWLCLVLAGLVLGLWLNTTNDQAAVVLASLVFIIGFVPTFRKSISKPHQETAMTFALNGLKFLIALSALDSFNVKTALYPITLTTMNLSFVGLLLIRRAHKPIRPKRPARR